MLWDFLSFAILAAAAGAALYTIAELWIHKNIESPINGVVVFVAITAAFSGAHLVKVAVDGDLNQLPPHIWRIHLGIAGAFGILLALQGLLTICKKLRQRPARQTTAGDSPPGNGANKEQGTNPDA